MQTQQAAELRSHQSIGVESANSTVGLPRYNIVKREMSGK